MIVSVVLAVLLGVLVIFLHAQISARLEVIERVLLRLQGLVGTEDGQRALAEAVRAHWVSAERDVVGRLERIEAAVDPMARARQDVARVMRELDDALQEDDANGYAHWKASNVEEQIKRGERPARDEWETWIRTPYPWS